ncbi:4'-phosphopantetheinyl transferase superfamily protein [Streptomyces sp. NPDC005805]|uniref:4'-phosphopantetheinyl transferase family protein n=1 Tax=Streptomyces sp. NPDC005805 TaxID=3157068 RepID=UPI0033C54492
MHHDAPTRPLPAPAAGPGPLLDHRVLPGHPGVFAARVAPNTAAARAGLGLLDERERERAAGFRFQQDADRYLVAHVLLRQTLAGLVGERPERLVFARRPCAGCGGPHGKPYLAHHALHFSLAHAGDHVLVATAGVPVGVDVEAVPSTRITEDVVPALHRVERAELAALAAADRPAAFTRCWVRKEAVLKATGVALTHGSADPLAGTGPVPAEVPGVRITDLPAAAGHAAALALVPDGG